MPSRYLKIAGVVLAILVVWNLLQSPALWEALLLFGASGVVPGTDTTLSPGATLRVLGVVLGLSFVLIFHKELWRGVRRVFGRRGRTTAVAPEDTGAASAPAAVSAATTAMPAPLDPLQVPAAPAPKPVVVIRVPGRKGKLAYWYHAVRPMVRPALRSVVAKARQSMLFVAAQAVRAWRWLEPRLRQFDRWIEKQLKSNPRIRAMLQSGNDAGRSLRVRREQVRSYLAKVAGK